MIIFLIPSIILGMSIFIFCLKDDDNLTNPYS